MADSVGGSTLLPPSSAVAVKAQVQRAYASGLGLRQVQELEEGRPWGSTAWPPFDCVTGEKFLKTLQNGGSLCVYASSVVSHSLRPH